MKIAILGAGNVGAALARRFASAGHTIVLGSREPGSAKNQALIAEIGAQETSLAAAVAESDIAFLTVPYMGIEETLGAIPSWNGRILVDCVNAVGPSYRPAIDPTTTVAEQVAALAPGACVVKAFNTVGWPIMADPTLEGRSTVLPICGDDADAKSVVADLASQIGFETIDTGTLAAAALVEHAAALWITLAYKQGLGTSFAFGLLRRDR